MIFEVTGAEIQMLDDSQLRTLIARLAIAELRAKSLPISGVTAGGDQNAADGGLDVRIELPHNSFSDDFIPCVPLGIQVKKPNMSKAAITAEMRPNGTLRTVIGELADSEGGYIIASSSASLADKPLRDRRDAMRAAVDGHPKADDLYTDFYDRERLASWVNVYPGVAAWVRSRIGRPLAGWQALGDWSGIRIGGKGTYIFDDAACLLDARSKEQTVLTIIDGIQAIRAALAEPGQCVRLIGTSGLGKTRLVQALFESNVGDTPLDPSLAIYADYSETPEPTAKQLALHLVETGQRAILVVDNCHPQTHSDLTKICSSGKSKISLITVEYDVREDDPERTEVFRLQSASQSTLTEWIKATFPNVSQVDRDCIAEFSGGNFRVASVLAETVKRGDTLGNLKDRELFGRIFQQRNDHSDNLLTTAEMLSLVYSFDGEDTTPDGELAALAALAGTNVSQLYGFVIELKKRAVVQSRGRWRAVLPHAIANRLASQALERIPPDQFDAFCAGLSPRLQKSLSRRIGYLHDCDAAKKTVTRWLTPNGPLGDLLETNEQSAQILRNIAPVSPVAIIDRIEQETTGQNAEALLNPRNPSRWQLTMILKSLAHDPTLFDRAVLTLSKFVGAEKPDENNNSAKGALEELFHLHLSGTQALPHQRRQAIRSLYEINDGDEPRCGHLALRALLQSGHFSSSSNYDFGARPRDFGWHPTTYGDIWNWYKDAIALAIELSANTKWRSEVKRCVSGGLRGILGIQACLDVIDIAITEILKDGDWLDGWFAVRGAIRFDGDSWLPEVKTRILEMEAKLRPVSALSEARAYIIGTRGIGFDLVDGDINEGNDYAAAIRRIEQKAESIGKAFAHDGAILEAFLPEVLQAEHARNAFSFGVGIADSGLPLAETWNAISSIFCHLPTQQRNATVLGGFVWRVNQLDENLCSVILDDVVTKPKLSHSFVFLQAKTGIDQAAISRLRFGISSGMLDARQFYNIANGTVRSAPQKELADLLGDIATLENGVDAALDVFHMAAHCYKDDRIEIDGAFLDRGHTLLMQKNYRSNSSNNEYRVQQVMETCYKGPQGELNARHLCHRIKQLIKQRDVYSWELDYVFNTMFALQPLVALDEFLTGMREGKYDPVYEETGLSRQSPLEKVPPDILWEWADIDPTNRYVLIGRSLHIFSGRDFDETNKLSSMFLEALERSPDRAAFLGGHVSRVGPSGWSGNLSTILDKRNAQLAMLADHEDAAVRAWVAERRIGLSSWADKERERESEREETFE